MDFIVFCITVAVVVVAWYHRRYNRRNKLLEKIPSIPSYPLIGSSFSFIGKSATQVFQVLEKATRDYGAVWRFDLSPFQTNIMVSDPKVVEALLSSQKLLDKSVEYDFIQKWLNDGEENIPTRGSHLIYI